MVEEYDDGRSAEEKACQKQACAIQYCLNRYKHQERKCKDVVNAYNECVEKAKKSFATTEK
eukprot:scaffold9825_cov203-Cylindrotheca_fusiformis.AAC.1